MVRNGVSAGICSVAALGANGGILPQTWALVNAMTVAPTAARVTLINNCIRSLILGGVWAKLDRFYMLAAHDGQAGRIDWRTAANVLTVVNAPTFTTDRGYTGDGTSAGLVNTYTPILHTQNNAHISAFGLTTTTNTNGDAGAIIPTPVVRSVIRVRTGTGAGGRSSSATTTAFTTATAVPRHCLSNRVSSANQVMYSNGALDVSAAVTSSSIANMNEFFILGSAVLSAYSNRQISAATIGAGLTSDEITTLYNAQLTYLQALGAV